jgi:hypothetical protein
MNTRNIVAFCCLMEQNGGIINKSPAYILEKFKRFCNDGNDDGWNWGLDKDNSNKVADWVLKWEIGK